MHYFCFLVFVFIFYSRFACLKNILVNGRGESNFGTDIAAQFFFFLKSLTQKSLCPIVFSKNHPKGALYYPLGIYWIATNISLYLKKQNRDNITYANLQDPNHYSSLALKVVLALNVLIFPIIAIAVAGILPFIIVKNSTYAVFLSIFSLVYQTYFFLVPYTVQTRTIGFYSSYILCSTLLILLNQDFNPLAFDFSQDLILLNDNLTLQNLFRLGVYTFSIFSLASLLFVCFRSSQQGSQFIISMLITICILLPSDYLYQS